MNMKKKYLASRPSDVKEVIGLIKIAQSINEKIFDEREKVITDTISELYNLHKRLTSEYDDLQIYKIKDSIEVHQKNLCELLNTKFK